MRTTAMTVCSAMSLTRTTLPTEISIFAIDQDLWEGSRWDNLDQILLQDDLGVPDVLLDVLGLDDKPVESRAIRSNNNRSNNSGWNVHGIAVELDQVVTMDHAGLGREGRSGGNPRDWKPCSRDWEDEVEWVGNADIAEVRLLLLWQNNHQVKAWDTLLEDNLSDDLEIVGIPLPDGWHLLNGAVGWSVVWPQVNLQELNELHLNVIKDLWHIDVLSINDNFVYSCNLKTDNVFQFNNSLWGDGGDLGDDFPQLEELWRLHAEGLLGFGGFSGSSGDDL